MSHHAHPVRRAAQALALASCVALGAAACTGSTQSGAQGQSGATGAATTSTQSGGAQSDPSTTSPTPTPSASADPEAEEAAATSPILGDRWTQSATSREPVRDPDGDGLVFHALRVAEHEGFYRVVVEFAGTGEPGWSMSWSDRPVEQGRGLPLDIEGTAFLDLRITGTTMPTAEGQAEQYYSGPSSLQVGPVDVVEDGTFEDQTHIAIGLDDVRDFQVGTLSDPARVVIDIRK